MTGSRVRVESLVLALSLASGLSLLGGCDTVRAPSGPKLDQLQASLYPKVSVEDPALAKVLAINPDKVMVEQGDSSRPMDVTVSLRSLADNAMNLQYKFQWFDAQGRQLEEDRWRDLRLPARIEEQVRSNPITTRASDWRLQVRSARTF